MPSTPRLFSRLVLVCTLAAASALVRAEKADNAQAMNIEADALRHDEARQLSVFTGRVVATKGSLVLRGARLEVRQDAQGNQHGLITGAVPGRAFFRQQLDTKPGQIPEYVEGEGEIIEYNARNDTVKFSRRSELRRYRGTQLSDTMTGSSIVYNRRTDVFAVDGQQSSGGLPSATPGADGRVRAVLTPRADGAAPADAAMGDADAPDVGNDKPLLRPSGRLDSLDAP